MSLGGPLPSNQQKCPPAQSPLAFGPHTKSRSSTTESDLNLFPTTYSSLQPYKPLDVIHLILQVLTLMMTPFRLLLLLLSGC